MSNVCPACGETPDQCYRCEHCGKDLVGTNEHDDRNVRADGSGELTATAHEIVLEQITDLQDASAHGAPIGEVVDGAIGQSEVRISEILDTVNWLHRNGEIYQPARGYFRRTEFVDHLAEDDVGGVES